MSYSPSSGPAMGYLPCHHPPILSRFCQAQQEICQQSKTPPLRSCQRIFAFPFDWEWVLNIWTWQHLEKDILNAIHSSCRRRGDQTHGTVHSNDRFPAYGCRDSPTASSSPTCKSARSPPRPFPSASALHAGNSGRMWYVH